MIFKEQDLSVCRIARLSVPCLSHEKILAQNFLSFYLRQRSAATEARGSAIIALPAHSYRQAKNGTPKTMTRTVLKVEQFADAQQYCIQKL